MLPILKAQQWYERYVPHGDFGADLADFLVQPGNVVVSRPDVFLVAEQVRWGGDSIVGGEANAWYVRLGAAADGTAPHRAFTKAAPWPHEYVLWQRRNDGNFRCRRFEDLAKKGK